jgi:hypothetical protein
MNLPKSFEIEDLPKLGWIRIFEYGEENVYFEYIENGHVFVGCIKVL